MAFGQAAGPPATHAQMRRLTELVEGAGHADLRDARGPLGLTQRQAGGRFTRDEAEALIAELEAAAEAAEAAGGSDGSDDAAPAPPRPPGRTSDRREAEQRRALGRVPSHLLAAELQQRGWIVIEP